MNSLTRAPRLLVKLSAAPDRANFAVGDKKLTLDVQFERLFKSIRPHEAVLGAAAPAEWYVVSAEQPGPEVHVWDLCHHLVGPGFGVAGLGAAEFAEPDLEQQWLPGTPTQLALAATRTCDNPTPPDTNLPNGAGTFWFRDSSHSQLEAARNEIGQPNPRVRIAHLDTGYDPDHKTKPRFLRADLQRNFVEEDRPNDATDRTDGFLTNLGHGTGTLSILAGADFQGSPLGGAPFLDVIPVRVANSVVLFKNSAIAKAFDYIHGLDSNNRAHVITMSMGGLASAAWADAVNALYEMGVFIVTAAGNNFGNLPTHNIVYPARFKRVVAACGVMADGSPYADLQPFTVMAGNYGPGSKMDTALAACTPNTPWARLGCSETVDLNGRGTSAATPQVAAAAALWIQRFQDHAQYRAYAEGWMKVEAVRKALFESAKLDRQDLRERLGRGLIQAEAALGQQPAAANALQKQPVDSASFPFLRVITGLGVAVPDARQRMLELEALQLAQQSPVLVSLLPDPDNPGEIPADRRRQILEALYDAPGASQTLRAELARHGASTSAAKPALPVLRLPPVALNKLRLAIEPPISAPNVRKLRVFAYDPMLGYDPEFLHLNETTLEVGWEAVQPGPVGEYLEVVDVDPASGCAYAPVDLNHPSLLAQSGLSPSEANPQLHQQMAYAVAMKTIEHFERALGRKALWAPRFVKYQQDGEACVERYYVQRLRIYPHAIREANAYYSPAKKALLLGYFPASNSDPGANLPGGTTFCALSHDIIAHETTHALLDGLHRYFGEPSNEDVLAFHEAFADIVALFQHFTVPEALRDQIRRTRGDLTRQNILGELAQQFGQAIGNRGALRSAIGTIENGKWKAYEPSRDDYANATEVHERGAVLVAAVFDAFLNIYRRRSEDLIRLATGGTGVLSGGEIPVDLVNRLADEASKTAGHVLNICIRALDYCPPVDLMFGDYIRALITADRDLVPDDKWGYRAAFIQGFRRRGIYPKNVRNLSAESLCWEAPELQLPIQGLLRTLELSWDLHVDRRTAFDVSNRNGGAVHDWFAEDSEVSDEALHALGFLRGAREMEVNGEPGTLRNFEVHSVRPVRRIGPDGQQRTDLVIEITQSWLAKAGGKYRGGCTLIVDLEQARIRYVVRKRVAHPDRVAEQQAFQARMADASLAVNYFGQEALSREPFAMMHRGV